MRRFEYSQGSSNKFWEVAVDSATVATRWGRLGASGQSKSKECASPEAAQKDAERQIARKTSKGYAEVACTAAATSPAATSPAATSPAATSPAATSPAATSPAATSPAATSPAGKSVSATPSPGPAPESVASATAAPTVSVSQTSAPAATAATPPPETTAELIPASIAEQAASWTDLHPRRGGAFQLTPSDDLGPRRKIVDEAAKIPVAHLLDGPWNPERALSVYQSLVHPHGYSTAPAGTAWVQLMLALHGPARTLEVWSGDQRWSRVVRYVARIEGVRDLRMAIAAASDEEYARAVAVATAWRAKAGTRHVDAATTYLFPTEPWWQAAGSCDNLHLTCVDDPTALPGFAQQHKLPFYNHIDSDILRTLLAEHGDRVIDFVAKCGLDSDYTDTVLETAQLYAGLPGLDPIRALLARHQQRVVRKVLGQLVVHRPQACIQAALEADASNAGLQRLLTGWVIEHRGAAEAVRPHLSAKSSVQLDRILEAFLNQGPQAPLDTLPALFTDPPWNRTVAKRPRAMKLAAALDEPSVRLHEAEQERALQLREEVERLRSAVNRLRLTWRGDPIQLVAVATAFPDEALQHVPRLRHFSNTEAGNAAIPCESILLAAAVCLPVETASKLALGLLAQGATSPLFNRFTSPAIAQAMLDALPTKGRSGMAQDWMRAQPEYATRAWIPTVVGRKSKKQAAALGALVQLRNEHPQAVAAGLGAYPEKVQAVLHGLLSVDPLLLLPSKVPPSDFVTLGTLPAARLRDGGARLPPPAMDVLIKCLALSGSDTVYVGLTQIQALITPDSLAEVATAVFFQWLDNGSPSQADWALTVLRRVGNDQTARSLTPQLRKWPGESQHKRAVKGLDVLLGIGTEVALMHLNGVAQKVKFAGIKREARLRIEALAKTLGLSSEQLADRLVPRLGLDEDGALLLDYGPRHFTVHFDEALRPVVRDDKGKLRRTLPKPGVRDDAATADPAHQRFKQLKKDVRTLATLQLRRFEAAMVTGRRWSVDDFRRYLVEHPLMCHLVRRVVWGVYADGTLLRSFRVADDDTFADSTDETCTLKKTEQGTHPPTLQQVGIAHPVELSPEALLEWAEVFADYELLQPFSQLDRPTFSLTPAERARTQLVRNPTQPVPAGRVLGLVSRGWERSAAEDAGVVWSLHMGLPDGRRLMINLGGGGLWMGAVHEQDQNPTIESMIVARSPAIHGPTSGEPLTTLSPAILSELLATLHQLQATE